MRFRGVLLLVYFVVLIWSAVAPKDYFTWFLEVLPAIIGLVILLVTHKSFPLTRLLYFLILIHCCILMVGGHYTYAEVPLFDTIQDFLGQSRNNYDKVGHFAQGFIPAIIVREVLLRKKVLQSGEWLNFLIVCVCMAISVTYELIEWLVAEMTGESAESFLGTQGYAWDTQSDMLYATIGAICALIFLSKAHDKQLDSVNNKILEHN